MDASLLGEVSEAVRQFIKWLDAYGEVSYDHQSFYAGSIGGRAKSLYYRNRIIGTLAVSPMVFLEAFFPRGRVLFWKPQRFPIADAHYAMGFAMLSRLYNSDECYERAVHFLNVLEETRCPGYERYCWGYPFDWVTRGGTIKAQTPLITTTPYVFEAFQEVYKIDKDERWLTIMKLIADHALMDIKDFYIDAKTSTCGYYPGDGGGGVINASAYRSFLLASTTVQLSDDKYWQVGERNLNFVLKSQQSDGSWFYASDGVRDFVDHFHTCFVLKALVKIEKLMSHEGCTHAIEKGIEYYVNNLLDDKGLPKPFAKAPRLTVYRNELYDYAECINLCTLLRGRFSEMDDLLVRVLNDLLRRWRKKDGSFRSRKLFLGWDNVPMHRWAQSQTFRSLCFFLCNEKCNT